jgi:hypothetical protein
MPLPAARSMDGARKATSVIANKRHFISNLLVSSYDSRI